MAHATDTIFAPATAPGRAGVSVFRLSGPKAHDALVAITGSALPQPRLATLRRLKHPTTGEAIDQALVLAFEAPNSFTGEHMVELHTHGGRAVSQSLLEALASLPGLRMAEPGEFSKQAFLNGKMDLTEAEGIADLIHAETAAQRKQALYVMEGGLREVYDRFRAQLLRSLALVEAYIDFPDEDLPVEVSDELKAEVDKLLDILTFQLKDDRRGERLRDGVSAVIIGAPNAGKSTLMNWLAKRDVSIVSGQAGTTRDVMEVHLDLGGYPAIVADTAGLRDSADDVEAEGIRRARARAEQADLKIAVFDAALLPALDAATSEQVDENTLIVLNKSDLAQDTLPRSVLCQMAYPVSLVSGEGLDALLAELEKRISGLLFSENTPIITRTRHRAAIERAVSHLERFQQGGEIELVGEELRLAALALASVTGRVDVEEILGEIFSSFCIGK